MDNLGPVKVFMELVVAINHGINLPKLTLLTITNLLQLGRHIFYFFTFFLVSWGRFPRFDKSNRKFTGGGHDADH